MGRKKIAAREGMHRNQRVLVYTDPKTGKRRRVSMESIGATNRALREMAIKRFQEEERLGAAKARIAGGYLNGAALLVDDLDDYLRHVEEQRELRKGNPAARLGLAPKSFKNIQITIKGFRTWLVESGKGNLLTSALEPGLLQKYVKHLAQSPIGVGSAGDGRPSKAARMRSGSTIRFHLRNLKAGLNWIRRSKKHRFEDFEDLSRALRAPATEVVRHEDVPVPGQMSAFLTAALEYETPGRLVTVSASGHGKRDRRTFSQRVHNQTATPVSRLFVLLALTGCRLSDALNLKWGNVRADYQQVRYTAIKNGANCVVPLVDTGFKAQVAPRLSRLLRQWRKEAYDAWVGSTEAGKRSFDEQFVLPHHEVKSPVFSRYAWRAVRELTNSGDLGPQVLRRAFTSYAATLGIPSAVVAQWQGHSPGVADKYYRLYAKAAVVDPKSMEEALGLASILDTMLKAGDATRGGADSHSSS